MSIQQIPNNKSIEQAFKDVRRAEIDKLRTLVNVLIEDDSIVRDDFVDILDMTIQTDDIGMAIEDFYYERYED